MATEEVQVEAAAYRAVGDVVVTEQPLLTMSIASINAMGGSVATSIVACLLIPREGSVNIAINGVAGIHGVEGLGEIVAEAPIMDVFS